MNKISKKSVSKAMKTYAMVLMVALIATASAALISSYHTAQQTIDISDGITFTTDTEIDTSLLTGGTSEFNITMVNDRPDAVYTEINTSCNLDMEGINVTYYVDGAEQTDTNGDGNINVNFALSSTSILTVETETDYLLEEGQYILTHEIIPVV